MEGCLSTVPKVDEREKKTLLSLGGNRGTLAIQKGRKGPLNKKSRFIKDKDQPEAYKTSRAFGTGKVERKLNQR